MKVIETNKYVVIQTIPNYLLQEIVDGELHDCEKYPNVFSRLYIFDTKETIEHSIYEGQNIWRIMTHSSGFLEIKCAKFSKQHIDMDIFPTWEHAKEELERRNKELSLKKDNKDVQNVITQICLSSNFDVSKSSFEEIQTRFKRINELANSIK